MEFPAPRKCLTARELESFLIKLPEELKDMPMCIVQKHPIKYPEDYLVFGISNIDIDIILKDLRHESK